MVRIQHVPSQNSTTPKPDDDPWYLQGPCQEWIDFCRVHGIPWCGMSSPDDECPFPDEFDEKITGAWTRGAQEEKKQKNYEVTVKISNLSIPRADEPNNPIPIRAYYPIAYYTQRGFAEPLPLYIHFRGGGFMCGNLDTEDAICAAMVSHLTSTCPIIVISVQYGSVLDAEYPQMFHDAWYVYEYMQKKIDAFGGDPNRVVLGGEDSGAMIALWVAMFAKKTDAVLMKHNKFKINIVGLVLTTPWFPHMDDETSAEGEVSRYQCWTAPFLPLYIHQLYRDFLDLKTLSDMSQFVIGKCSDFSGLPKTFILVAGQSLLRDQAVRLARYLQNAGVELLIRMVAGMPHDFRRVYALDASELANADVEDAVRWILNLPTLFQE
ncbi:hypothetical protein ASPBRDRAFT_138930 [Aspergillus brasiliensis CBS 101740]|uniref:Alpha/beta hydrolase fold-3 domain-containing protein n=1 Tax=Aspergillus brasiliensis (strain CBS 101740 / IMI 381727 / IBT 21946) TaxID=767769 RepID=A0A1L9U2Y1_ASPBC|nr:hypothetical protein ASPBRDRAFT_138930 [Aspergillus brasiliensis CBS 101740]